MYMGDIKNKKPRITYMDLRTRRGHWSYTYVAGHIPNHIQEVHMVSELRFRYKQYIFYVNRYPIQENNTDPKLKRKVYNVTCAVSGLALVTSVTNDESYLRQEILRKLNLPNFEETFLMTVDFICQLTGRENTYNQTMNTAILTTLL
jgi:hypothetical protein